MLARIKSARRGISVLGLKGGEALVGAAMTIYLARVMGPSAFGYFAFGLATTTLLAIPIKSGASNLITKHVAIAHESSGDHLAGPLLARGIFLALFYAGLILATLWGARVSGADNSFLASVSVMALALPFLCLTGLWEGVLRGSFRPNAAILVGTVLPPLTLLGMAAILQPQLAARGWPMAAALFVGAAAGINLLALIWARPHLNRLLPVATSERLSVRVWVGHAAPFALVTGLLIFNRQIDVILLGALQGEEAAGIYRIGAQAAVLVTFGVQAIGHLYAPYLAKIGGDAEPNALSDYLQRSVLFSFTLGLLVLGLLALWGGEIIARLAGPEYLPSYPIMLILCAANLAVALNGVSMQALIMQGYQSRIAWVFAGAGAFSVVANASLIPIWDIYGAAIATSCSIVMWTLGVRRMACRAWGLSFITLGPAR